MIDDGSTDNSREICESYALKDKRFHYYYKSNGGVSSARNLGLTKINGDFVIFIDSDDWIERNYVFSLVDGISLNKDHFVLCGYTIDVEKEKKVLKSKEYKLESINVDVKNDYIRYFPKLVDNRFILSPWAKIFLTSVIKDNNLQFDTTKSIGEDLLFNLDYLNCVKKISIIENKGYHYILSDKESLTKKFGNERISNSYSLFVKGTDFLNKNNMKELNWVFYKYYYKSQMNYIESQISNNIDRKNVTREIIQILNQNVSNIDCSNVKDFELNFYRTIFKFKSPLLIKIGCYIRIFIKKSIRKF